MSEDIVTAEGTVWSFLTSATASAGCVDNVLAPPGGSAVAAAEVNDVMITVDFALTRQLILSTTPMSVNDADQGLADLAVLVSPGVSLRGFAPQFGATPVALVDAVWRSLLVLALGACGCAMALGRQRTA